jgi:hypothetical protein
MASYLVSQLAGNDHVVATRTDLFVFGELGSAHDGLADVDQLTVPPHLFGRATAAHPCAKTLNELLAIHRSSGRLQCESSGTLKHGPCQPAFCLLSARAAPLYIRHNCDTNPAQRVRQGQPGLPRLETSLYAARDPF